MRPEEATPAERQAFRRLTAELGLTLAEDDLLVLLAGWRGMQPFVARMRTGLLLCQPLPQPTK